jgi:hypothetical protein
MDWDKILQDLVQKVDGWGNTHYIYNNLVYAVFLPSAEFSCCVYPDESGPRIQVRVTQEPTAVVYAHPIDILTDLDQWMVSQRYYGFFSCCVINGLSFYTDFVPHTWEKPLLLNAHTSVYDGGYPQHALAKQILASQTYAPWDEGFLMRYEEHVVSDFIKTQLHRLD